MAPAGSLESLKAAIHAGADAVYIGGTKFGARAYANNLPESDLLQALDYVHLHQKKLYLTVNTLLKQEELAGQLYDYLLPYYENGLDAVIVQDIGVFNFIRKQFPDLAVHASTQMNMTHFSGIHALKNLGIKRVVTARELNLQEISEIAKTGIEVESFVHGALCYCYSGQCLLSSLIGQRSGNRGRCAQPCRLPYEVYQGGQIQNPREPYVLSPKDICTLDILPQILDAGVYSLKIEGRMKQPEYTALTVSKYRKYLDRYFSSDRPYQVEAQDIQELMDIYNRGGFSSGYYRQQNGKQMISLTRPNHQGVKAAKIQSGKTLLQLQALTHLQKGDVLEISKEAYTLGNAVKKGSTFYLQIRKNARLPKDGVVYRMRNQNLIERIRQQYIENERKISLYAHVYIQEEKPISLEITDQITTVTVVSLIPLQAQKQPLTKEKIIKQIAKTGNTIYQFENIDITLDSGLFVTPVVLNQLRRDGLQKWEEETLKSYRKSIDSKAKKILVKTKPASTGIEQADSCMEFAFSCQIETAGQYEKVIEYAELLSIRDIYCDIFSVGNPKENWKEKVHMAHEKHMKVYAALPHIFRQQSQKWLERNGTYLQELNLDGFLIRDLDGFFYIKQYWKQNQHPEAKEEFEYIWDNTVPIMNDSAWEFAKSQGCSRIILPYELNYRELKDYPVKQQEMVIYAYIPVMITANCITKTVSSCQKNKKQEEFLLKDRKKKEFFVKNVCDSCYNIIYNGKPLSLISRKQELELLEAKRFCLKFTRETKEEAERILQYVKRTWIDGETLDEILDSTRGHFYRGVE